MDTCIDFGDPAEMMRLAFATLASHERVWRERIDGWTDHTMTVEGWHERPYEGDIERAARLRRFAERRMAWLKDVNLRERLCGPSTIDATDEPVWFAEVAKRWPRGTGYSRWKSDRLHKLLSDPHDPAHGTVYGYRLGCRCERCGAMADEFRERYREQKARCKAKRRAEIMANPHDPAHGTMHGYWLGCHCERCQQRYREHKAARR